MASATFSSGASSAGSRRVCAAAGPPNAAASPASNPPPMTSRRSTMRSSSYCDGRGRRSVLHIDLAGLPELLGLLTHPLAQRVGARQVVVRRVVAHLLRQLHRAELRTTHRAEVRDLRTVGRKRLVVIRA